MINPWISHISKTKLRKTRTQVIQAPLLLIIGILVLFAWITPASAATQDLSWVGSNGYTMMGGFSYNGALTGTIDETQIDSLMIEGFRYGASLGTWDLADGLGNGALPLEFNFDTTTNEFLVGGLPQSGMVQVWNALADPGLGFVSGGDGNITAEGLMQDGDNIFDSISVNAVSTLTVGTLDQFTETSFDLSWVGANGYSMSGMFSYWDVFDDGVIEGNNLTSLMIEGFRYGASLGTWDLVADGLGNGALPLEFNFDTTTNEFLVGGLPEDDMAQLWNVFSNPGLGFGSTGDGINTAEGLLQDGGLIIDSFLIDAGSTLTATPKEGITQEPIPEPATVALLGIGIVGLAGAEVRRRRKKKAVDNSQVNI